MPKIKTEDLVEVEWFDTFTLSYGWAKPQDYLEDAEEAICRSIGYVLKSSKKKIVIVQSHGLGKVSQALVIPRVNVIRVKKLKGLK